MGSGGLSYVSREVKRRLAKPAGHFTFWVYLLVGIGGASAFGVWYELLPLLLGRPGADQDSLFTALLTFFPALAGPSALQLLLEDNPKPMRTFAIFLVVVFFALVVWLGFAQPECAWIAYLSAGFSCLLAVLVWWITGGQDRAYNDGNEDRFPLGGRPEDQPTGSLEGYQA